MITKEQFIANYERIKELGIAFTTECIEEDKKIILTSDDPKEREKAMNDLSYNYYSYESREKGLDIKNLEQKYNDVVNMTEELSKAFKCEWINDLEFAVQTNHERLSDFAIMLSKWFGITSTSGFTFSSSFTTHNGKTANGLYLDITCIDDGRGLLVFKGLNPSLPYWLPQSFVEKYEKNIK